MRVMVPNYRHRAGRHCGTTTLSNLFQFYGHPITEPLCLGLGSGITFFYLANDQGRPTRMWLGRGPNLEIDCLQALGANVVIRRTRDNAEGWSWVKGEIDAGRPAMIGVDLRWLDFYQTKTHFGGHRVMVIGYDEERQLAVIGDNQFPEPQVVPLASLTRARTDTVLPFDLANDWFQWRLPHELTPLERAVPAALALTAQRMLAPALPIFGLTALEAAARELPGWNQVPDWRWCARFGYQVIERRGTGGGNFRRMYVEFLEQAVPYCPDIVARGLIEQMRVIAEAWTDFALLLHDISERDMPTGFDEASARLGEIARLERAYHENAGQCRGPGIPS